MRFGADPEFVIVEKATGTPVPAHKFFGDKYHKKQVETVRGPAALFRDGFNLEINVPPQDCRALLVAGMKDAVVAAKAHLGPAFDLVSPQSVAVDLSFVKDAPEDVQQFGCEPSYCAYRLVPKVPDINAVDHPFRYAGGHMHFSLDARGFIKNPDNHIDIIRLLDLYLGLPLTALFGDANSIQRRKYYGQAGEFRTQDYKGDGSLIGVEYRTPGPEVWTNDNIIASWAFGIGKYVISHFAELRRTLDPAKFDATREAIDVAPEKAWDLMRAVPGFYTADFLKVLKPKLHRKVTIDTMAHESHTGFAEIVGADWGIQIPGLPELRRQPGYTNLFPPAYHSTDGYQAKDPTTGAWKSWRRDRNEIDI